MVRKILALIYKGFLDREVNSLNSAALLLGFFSLISQVAGFLRDRLLAHRFGAGESLDIYYAAFRLPDFLFVSVASVVSLSVLIPFIIEKDKQGGRELRAFIDSVFTFFSLLITASALVCFFFMPVLSRFFFQGFSPEALDQVIFLSRLLLLSPVLLGLSNLFGSLSQAYSRFAIYAIAPILYNLGIIAGIILFSSEMGVLGVVLGVILGALMHLLVQVPLVYKLRLLPRLFGSAFDWSLIKSVVRISLPRTLTLSMSALTLLILTAIASNFAPGSVSVLTLSNNLQAVSLSLIGVSYSLAAFPTLTRKWQEKDLPAFIEQMQISSRFIIFWSLPLSALLVVLRAQIVRVLLGSGLFDWQATRLTAAALALFVISSLFQSLLLLFMRGFYSAGLTRKPFVINLFSTLVLLLGTYGLVSLFTRFSGFSYFILSLLKVEDLSNSVILMLPLGFSLGTILNVVLLWRAFEREFPGYSQGLSRTLFEGVGASVVMGATSYGALQIFSRFLDVDTFLGIFLQGFLSALLGIAMAVLILILLKSRELKSVWQSLRGVSRAEVIATDPEIV